MPGLASRSMAAALDLDAAPASELESVRGVFLDIDDTLSTEGKLTADAYAALWRLHQAGLGVVPVTGRPAGWCDHIARFWPVDAVIGENGAFVQALVEGRLHKWLTPGTDGARTTKLADLAARIRREFAQVRFASDQAYREHDLAVDFCEDVPRWPAGDIERLLKICADAGATAKVSSIHVNAWFGDYDKSSGIDAFFALSNRGAPSASQPSGAPAFASLASTARDPASWIFIGDSPNDEPLFARFARSVGVANVRDFADRIVRAPRWITRGRSGAGFVELTERLLSARRP